MTGRMRSAGLAAGISLIAAATGVPFAQAQTDAPLSVIDWLGAQSGADPAVEQPGITLDEPPVTETALVPDVTVAPLGESGPRLIGLVPPDVTGLPADIWAGSDPDRLQALLDGLPDFKLPAAQSLLYTVLLAEAQAPAGRPSAGDALALARVRALMRQGALDPALSLIEQAGVATSAAHFDLWMEISLLTGNEDRGCAVLAASPHLTRDYGVRIFCAARAGQWENAALTLGSAEALSLMPEEKLALLARFLEPELPEAAPQHAQIRPMDALSFRLFETIGEPVPTTGLARAFAVADLRDLAGWKAQLLAAERLSRAGAVPDNRLLGLYTDRRPAASGGVWDRVARLQRFETALSTGSVDAVAKTLPPVWDAFADAGLEVSFANLFAAPLAEITLTGQAARIARDVQLLSPRYETAAMTMEDGRLATRIALGDVPPTRPSDPMPAAVYDAFDRAPPRAELVAMVAQKRLGEAILQTLDMLHKGAGGNAKALTDALATLRALGLEDTARRAALQTLLLKR